MEWMLPEQRLTVSETADIVRDMQQIISRSQTAAYQAVNSALVQRNWLIGYRIAREELKSDDHAENYGLEVIKKLSRKLTELYGKGFTKTNLYSFYSFYKTYPEIFHTACGNLSRCCPGRIIEPCYRLQTRKPVPGMRGRPGSKHGACVPCSAIFPANIIIES